MENLVLESLSMLILQIQITSLESGFIWKQLLNWYYIFLRAKLPRRSYDDRSMNNIAKYNSKITSYSSYWITSNKCDVAVVPNIWNLRGILSYDNALLNYFLFWISMYDSLRRYLEPFKERTICISRCFVLSKL